MLYSSDIIPKDKPGCTGPECDGANGQQPVGDASGCEYDISKKYSDRYLQFYLNIMGLFI